jgi:photosystem II stability/assembly factor-like uncharacterized protein
MRSRILLFFTLLCALALCNTASAQWVQTSGPSGGQVSSFIKTPTGWLAVIGQGLYRYDQNRWTQLAPQWYGQLFQAGNVALTAHVNTAKVSTNFGETWTSTKLPSDFVLVKSDHFISTSSDSLFRSTDGINWTFYARLPEQSFTLVEHKGKLYTQAGFDGLMSSTDEGVTWTKLDVQPEFSIVMEWHSTENELFALPYPSGIFSSTDEGTTWRARNLNLDEHTIFEAVASNGTDVFVSDWLTTYQLRDERWVEAPIAQIHASKAIDGKIYMATNNGLVEYANGKLTHMDQGMYSANVSIFGSVGNALFARSASGLYRTMDGGDTWQFNSTMYAMDMATAKGSMVVRGTSIMRTTDQGNTWINLDGQLADFVLAPTDLISSGENLYLTSGLVSAGEHGSGAGWTTGGVYTSTDGGESWREISGNLPENLWTKVPVYTIAAANGKLVIWTADGLFATNEGSSSWHRVSAPSMKYALDIFSTGKSFYMIADSTWYTSVDGDQWTMLNATAPADFMTKYAAVSGFASIRGIPHIATSQYEMIDSMKYRTINRNFKLENNAWIDITSSLPQNTMTTPMIEHQGALYAGTSTLGVWKLALPASDVAVGEDAKHLDVYPNPTSAFVVLSAPSTNVMIYNSLGLDVTSMIKRDGSTLDVRSLPTGVYHLMIDGKKASFVKQ